MKKNRLLTFVIFCLALNACKKDHMFDCFKSAGETKTESRDASSFANIDLTDNVDLVIVPDTSFYIKVTAGENLISGIITELSGNTLYIRNENRCNWMRSFSNTYTVEVGMDKPVNIHYDGSGNISCLDTIRSDEFTFDCYGGSGTISFILNANKTHLNNHIGRTDIHASGFSKENYIYINDVGVADASELISEFCYVRSNSTGDIKINATTQFGFEILYVGNVYYSGNPTITSQLISGSGNLIHY